MILSEAAEELDHPLYVISCKGVGVVLAASPILLQPWSNTIYPIVLEKSCQLVLTNAKTHTKTTT